MIKNDFLYGKLSKNVLFFLLDNGENYLTLIAKKLNINYSALWKHLNKFEKLGLIKSERKGRIRFVKLTPKGILIANHLKEIYEMIE